MSDWVNDYTDINDEQALEEWASYEVDYWLEKFYGNPTK